MNSDIDERRGAILRAVVESYVRAGEPVGSAYVASLPQIAVSPATIRNEMSALDTAGYLRQPHTSAGRIPTEKGYRHYVDALMGDSHVKQQDAEQVGDFFSGTHKEIEDLLFSTARLLTSITDCVAIVTGPSPTQARVVSVQLIALGHRNVLIMVVDANGSVEKRTVEWPGEPDEAVLAEIGRRLTTHFRAKEAGEVGSAPKAEDPELDALLSASFKAAKDAVADAELDGIFIDGTSTVASSFDALETVRGIISILERHYTVLSLMRKVMSRGQVVSIGSEHGIRPLSECAVIVEPYRVDGVEVGTVGLIGPTRMNYGSVIGTARLVSDGLGRRLSEG